MVWLERRLKDEAFLNEMQLFKLVGVPDQDRRGYPRGLRTGNDPESATALQVLFL